MDDLLNETVCLSSIGISTPLSFFGGESEEPSALCWISIVSVLVHDADGPLIEYLDRLNKEIKALSWDKYLVKMA